MNGSTVSLTAKSDERLKQDIGATKINAMNILKSMEVVDYSFIKSPETRHTGYIAQDVKEVLPSMVVYNERDDIYGVSQTELIPVLHKAILEQQETIDAQSKKIEELEFLVNQLLNK